MSPLNLTLNLTGKSKNIYSFQLFHFGHVSYPIKAIYVVGKILINEMGSKRCKVLYIGKTGDMQSRFSCHHKDDDFKKNGANCIGILYEENANSRDLIERDLIPAYNPPCNEMLTS